MARHEQADFQLYFSRVRPIYYRLFNLAHAITGNSEQAAYCVQYAMLDCWATGDASASRHGFREGLRSSTMEAALRIADTEDVEEDWNGLCIDEGESDALMRIVGEEEQPLRRILALRWGCGLSPRRIARLLDDGHIAAQIHSFEQRANRKLGISHGKTNEAALARAIRRRMAEPSPLAPEMGVVFRGFAADAASVSPPSRLPARIFRCILTAVVTILCIIAFWLVAVLIQPSTVEGSTPQVENAMLMTSMR